MIKNRIKSLGLLALTMSVVNSEGNSAQTKTTEVASSKTEVQNLELTKRELRKILKRIPDLLESLEVNRFRTCKTVRKKGNNDTLEHERHVYEGSIFVDQDETIDLKTNDYESYNHHPVYSDQNKTIENKESNADAFMRCNRLDSLITYNGEVRSKVKQTICHTQYRIPIKILNDLIAELRSEKPADSADTSSK